MTLPLTQVRWTDPDALGYGWATAPIIHRDGRVLGLHLATVMASQGFSWRLATSNADLTAAYNLRNEVFKEQGFDPNRELDTYVALLTVASMRLPRRSS